MSDEQQRPEQQQEPPGTTEAMVPRPRDTMEAYEGRGLLEGRRALVTGGDSGIGRAVAVAFAKEGADVGVAYLCEDDDAERTRELVEKEGRRCLLLPGDLSQEEHAKAVVARTVGELGGIDVLVSNAATQQPQERLEDISTEQWRRTFATNLDSCFFLTRAALPHLQRGSSIIITSSVTGLRGNKSLIDYASTKGALISLTYSLAQSLMDRGIRVNCVAPGPVWTPLIPSTFDPEKVASFGQQAPMGRAADPDDIAPSYVFLASDRLSGFYTGEVLAPVGGETMPG